MNTHICVICVFVYLNRCVSVFLNCCVSAFVCVKLSFISMGLVSIFVSSIKVHIMAKKEEPLKLLRYQHARMLMERKDEEGRCVPFRMRYVTMRGEIQEFKNVITTSVNVRKRMRTIRFMDSGEQRTIHDVLILSVNDTKIIVN